MRNSLLVPTTGAALIVLVMASGGARPSSGTGKDATQSDERKERSAPSGHASALGTIAEFLGAAEPDSDEVLREAGELRVFANSRGYTLRSIVAIVPDPVRAHNAAMFDLAIVGIQKAAGYMGLQLDRHWFPWTPPDAGTGTPADGSGKRATSSEEDAAEAGVILFRKPTRPQAGGRRSTERGELVVVFLVGESPIIGVSARQPGHALSAAAGLGSSAKGGNVALPGPFSSRAAVPINRYAPGWWRDTWGMLEGEWRLRFVSGTATGGAVSSLLGTQLEEESRLPGGNPARGVSTPRLTSRFTATVLPDAVAGARFLSFAERSLGWRPKEQTAVLFEMDSAYGRGFAGTARVRMVLPLPSQVAAVRSEWDRTSGLEDRTPPTSISTPRMFLNLNLGDRARPVDVIPETAALTTTVNDFAIGASLEQLERAHIKQVGIFLTDVRDKLYLIRLLRQRMPDLVVFTSEAHMLLAHPAASGYLDGLLAYSSYPLRPETQAVASGMRVSFSSAAEQGIFNAFCSLLSGTEASQPGKQNLIDYYADGAAPGRLAPALWISVVSRGRFTPVAVLRTPVVATTGTSKAGTVSGIEVVRSEGGQVNTAAAWGYGGSWVFAALLALPLLGPLPFLLLLRRQVQLDEELGAARPRGERSRILATSGLGFALGAASGATLGLLAACGVAAQRSPVWLPWARLAAVLAAGAALVAAAVVLARRGEGTGDRAALGLGAFGKIALLVGLAVGATWTFGADPDGLRSLRYLSGLRERSPVPGLVYLLVAATGFVVCQLARETVKVAFLGLAPDRCDPNATGEGEAKSRGPAASSTFSKALAALKKLDGELRNSWSRGRRRWMLGLAFANLVLVAALSQRLFLDVAIGRQEVRFVFLTALAGLGAASAASFVRFQSTWRSVDRLCRRVEVERDEWDALQRVTSDELERRPAKGDGGKNEPEWSPLRAFSVLRPPSQRTLQRTVAVLRDLVKARHSWHEDLQTRLKSAIGVLDVQVASLAEHSGGPWLSREAVRASARANDEAAGILDSLATTESLPEKTLDLLAVREIAHVSAAFRLMRNDVLFLISGTFLTFLGILLFPFEPKLLTLRVFGLFTTLIAIPVLSTFAKMNRSALLSLLSGSNAGDAEIFSLEYVKKAATFLAVPVLSLLTTAFPEVWQPLGKVIWPLITGGGK